MTQTNLPPELGNPSAFAPQAVAQPAGLPTFCMIVFIIDLILCTLRLLIVPFSIMGYFVLVNEDPAMATAALFEIALGLIVGVLGIAANGLLLAKKPWALQLGYGLIGATVLSYAGALWQLAIQAGYYDHSGPEFIGLLIGGGVTVLIRLGLLALFVAALMRFKRWINEQPTALA